MKKLFRLASATLVFLYLSACSAPAATADRTSAYSGIHILSHFTIPRTEVNGELVSELSGLAWDQDEQLLYALSDRGKLFKFQLTIANDQITAVKPVFGQRLQDAKGNPLRNRDSEGLSVRYARNGKKGDTQLIISFEHGPRLMRANAQGKQIADEKINPALQDKRQYVDPNKMLESVVSHPKYGLITAPEHPLKGQPNNLHTLYAENKQWSFMAYPAPNSSMTGMELLPDNSLLILERAWSGFPNPLVISLRRVDLDACSKEGACHAQNLGVYSSLLSVDNYEGLAHIKDNLYLMVSDDGQNNLLRTQLTLFRVE